MVFSYQKISKTTGVEVNINIKKRDGTLEPYDANKINRALEKATRGLDDQISKVVQIATELSLSPKTVDTHRTNLMRKLGVHDAQALARFAVRRGLL